MTQEIIRDLSAYLYYKKADEVAVLSRDGQLELLANFSEPALSEMRLHLDTAASKVMKAYGNIYDTHRGESNARIIFVVAQPEKNRYSLTPIRQFNEQEKMSRIENSEPITLRLFQSTPEQL